MTVVGYGVVILSSSLIDGREQRGKHTAVVHVVAGNITVLVTHQYCKKRTHS